jgi:hypothetical protein
MKFECLHDVEGICMIDMTLTVPDELAERLEPIGPWLPTVIELGLLGFRTRAAAAVTEVVGFLATNPSPNEVLKFHLSDEAQMRLRGLLALNSEGLLSEEERRELDELAQLEHVIIMMKARIAR